MNVHSVGPLCWVTAIQVAWRDGRVPIGADGKPKRATSAQILIDGLAGTGDADMQQHRKRARAGATQSTQPLSGSRLADTGRLDFAIARGYDPEAQLMGMEMDWPVSRDFSLAGEMSSTVPLSSMPWIFSGRILGRYHLAGRRDGGVRAFGGLGYERIWLEDRGNVIGNINSDSGPMLILGIEARF